MKIVIDGEAVEIPGGGGDGGVPPGFIGLWSGTADNIPTGWALCDGQGGRPDLRDKFVLGAGTAHAVGDTGGEETHTLTVAEMPNHRHVVNYSNPDNTSTNGSQTRVSSIISSGTAQGDTTAVGGSQPHNNMPPYYALCYIMKL